MMTRQCYEVERMVEFTIQTVVSQNVFNPMLILINCGAELFYIVSALTAQFANINYEDWFSFSFWMGDLVYRVLVADHSSYLL